MKRKELQIQKTATCPNCSVKYCLSTEKDSYFIILNVEHQLKRLFEDKELLGEVIRTANLWRENKMESVNNVTDICDGELVNRNSFFEDKSEESIILTLNINIDVIPLFNTTTKSLWPILLTINEFSPEQQFKKFMLGGAFYTDTEPDHRLMNKVDRC